MDKQFAGVIPALMTSTDANDRVDFKALERHIEYLIEKGVSGLYLTGSTGEGFLLEREERNSVVEATVQIAKGRISVIAHTGTISLKQAIALSERAQELGADAISSVPPFYYGFSEDEIHGYYKAIAEATDIPFFIYNIPATTGVDLSISTLSRLLAIKNVIGLKYTSVDIFKMEQIINLPEKPIVFSGADEMSFYGLWAGAAALVGSSYNFLADTVNAMYQFFCKEDYQKAHLNYCLASDLLRVFLGYPYFAAVRKAIEWDGCGIGKPMKPFISLTREQEASLKKKLKDTIALHPEGVTSLRNRL